VQKAELPFVMATEALRMM